MYDSRILPLIDSILIKSFVSGLLVVFIVQGKMIKYQDVLPTRHTDGQKCLPDNVKLSQLACPTPVCQSIRKRATSHNRCRVGQSAPPAAPYPPRQLMQHPTSQPVSPVATAVEPNAGRPSVHAAISSSHLTISEGQRRVTAACRCDRQCVTDEYNSSSDKTERKQKTHFSSVEWWLSLRPEASYAKEGI